MIRVVLSILLLFYCNGVQAAVNLLSVNAFEQQGYGYTRFVFDAQLSSDTISTSTRFGEIILSVDGARSSIGIVKEAQIDQTVWGLRLIVKTADISDFDVSVIGPMVLLKYRSNTIRNYDEEAGTLMTKAKEFPDQELQLLREILMLPDNKYQQEAHRKIIDHAIRNQEPIKAQAELKQYVERWPDATDIEKQRQKLIALEIDTPKISKKLQPLEFNRREIETTGSIGYYRVSGYTEGKQDQLTDLTSVGLTSKIQWDSYKAKAQFRYSQNIDQLRPETSIHRVSLANVEVEDRGSGWYTKVGRQYQIGRAHV